MSGGGRRGTVAEVGAVAGGTVAIEQEVGPGGGGVQIDEALLHEPAEKALAHALKSIASTADAAWAAGNYTANLQALAGLKAPVDAFFDGVMVNAEDPALKANRLGLLATLHQAMNRVADLSKLAA